MHWGGHVTKIIHWSCAHIYLFQIAISKLFEWLFSRVLTSHRVRFQAGHVSLGTARLRWRWPWSSLFITSYIPAANYCTGRQQCLTTCPNGENKAHCTNLCYSLVYLEFIQLLFLFPRWRIFQSLQWDPKYLSIKGIFYIKKLQAHFSVLITSKQAARYMSSSDRG